MFELRVTTPTAIDKFPLDGNIEIGVGMEPQDVFRWLTTLVFHVEKNGTLPELKKHCHHDKVKMNAAYAFDTETIHVGVHCQDCDWEFSGSAKAAAAGY